MDVRPAPTLVVLVFAFASSLFVFAASSQHGMTDRKEMSGMDHGKPTGAISAQSAAQDLKDARVSELNHRLAGFILFVASMFVLAEESIAKRRSSASYAWPLCLLFAGIFVLVFSDAEIWPLGSQTPWYALTHGWTIAGAVLFIVLIAALPRLTLFVYVVILSFLERFWSSTDNTSL